MDKVRTYRTNPLLSAVIILILVAGIFSIDIDELLIFYTDPVLTIFVLFAVIVMPIIFFFGFRVRLFSNRIVYRHNLFFVKDFKIEVISHILYQATWRGVNSQAKSARSLHIVRLSGGWNQTISLANGAFREEDLADIARRLMLMNPRIETDEYVRRLVKKYAPNDF